MSHTHLNHISYLLPRAQPGAQPFFADLAGLLGEARGAEVEDDRLLLAPTNPKAALPATTIQLADVPFPSVAFDVEAPIDVYAGPFRLHSVAVAAEPAEVQPEDTGEQGQLLTMEEVARRVRGHITRVDHTGVNLPVHLLLRTEWDALIRRLAGVAAVYRYPGGPRWPFILPATRDEVTGDVEDFVAGREPKFELVYDANARHPGIQISVGTDLTRAEAEALFPDPYGVAFPELGEIFRTIYIAQPWPAFWVRLDLNYKSDGEPDPWETGESLVKIGGRI